MLASIALGRRELGKVLHKVLHVLYGVHAFGVGGVLLELVHQLLARHANVPKVGVPAGF